MTAVLIRAGTLPRPRPSTCQRTTAIGWTPSRVSHKANTSPVGPAPTIRTSTSASAAEDARMVRNPAPLPPDRCPVRYFDSSPALTPSARPARQRSRLIPSIDDPAFFRYRCRQSTRYAWRPLRARNSGAHPAGTDATLMAGTIQLEPFGTTHVEDPACGTRPGRTLCAVSGEPTRPWDAR